LYVDREPQLLFELAEVGWYRELTRPYIMGTGFLLSLDNRYL